MNVDVRILRKGNCLSLSGRSELTYEFGHNNKTIMFRIADNTGSGHYCSAWISLDAILEMLDKAKEPFSLGVFKTLYPGQSSNNVGFLGAVLLKEGLVKSEKRHYVRKDPKAFLTEVKQLSATKSEKQISAPRKSRKSTTSLQEPKEQP